MTAFLFWSIILLVIGFTITNGFLDGGGILSTVIATRAMNPFPALVLVASCEAAGLFVLGHAVARTVGFKLFSFPITAAPEKILAVLVCALLGALSWNVIMWRLSLPTSSSHSMIGGLLGASLMGFGISSIQLPVAVTILILLGVGPWLAASFSFVLSKALSTLGQWVVPAVSSILHKIHGAVSGALALAHGSMDGQKSLAIIWMALASFSSGTSRLHFVAPYLCSGALTLGVILGSNRTMRTLGRGLYPMGSREGLCAESAAMTVVGVGSLLGWPMSTSHAMSSAVLGAGAAARPKGIRWGTASEIALAWIFTIPATGIMAAIIFKLFQRGFHVVP
jgi:PiT family inorganic phosphate transporter